MYYDSNKLKEFINMAIEEGIYAGAFWREHNEGLDAIPETEVQRLLKSVKESLKETLKIRDVRDELIMKDRLGNKFAFDKNTQQFGIIINDS